MKKYIITSGFILLAMISVNAQVSIGGNQVVEGTATILDFNSTATNTKGIILPALEAEPVFTITPGISSPNNGTFIFDRAEKKVKMFENNDWVDLSAVGNESQISVNSSDESSSEQGVIIGSDTSFAKGVLVLESLNKGMILPKIANPHTSVESPYPGMMCFDTVSKSLAVFDGSVWNYWK